MSFGFLGNRINNILGKLSSKTKGNNTDFKDDEKFDDSYDVDTLSVKSLIGMALESVNKVVYTNINDITQDNYTDYLYGLLNDENIAKLLIKISRMDVLSTEFSQKLKDNVRLLQSIKKLKFWYNFNELMFIVAFRDLWCV